MALIVDAPMPKNCLSCPSKEHCLAFGKVHFNERLKMLDECRRADNCPIIGEIPDKHGELKDCSVLLHYLAHMKGATEHDHALLKTFEKMIRECPTIVEATE